LSLFILTAITLKKYPLSIAPMMDWTDRHYRYFMRQITRHTLLYTEMVTSRAILHGDREKLLGFSEIEKPLVLQLGGDNPQELAECAKIAEEMGYDEINLNVGCPSERVQQGNFGACLMANPELVGECMEAMISSVKIPVSVKHRIGINGRDSYEELADFVKTVAESGCRRFIVHARIAVLQGLSPRENRTVPPLRYEDVYRLKADFPGLMIEINGGIKTLEEVAEHLQVVDGAMLGRIAYENPYLFAGADAMFYNSCQPVPNRREIIEEMVPYLCRCQEKNIPVNRVLIHMLGLFNNQPGSKIWKRYLSENMHKKGKGPEILREVLELSQLTPKSPSLSIRPT
jgi:tRNA-dihydrouridine synthase A